MSRRVQIVVVIVLVAVLAVIVGGRFIPRAPDRYAKLVARGETAHQKAFGANERHWLNRRRYDHLEAMAETLRVGRYDYDSGLLQILPFYDETFGTVDQPSSAEAWSQHLDRLRDWMDTWPNSVPARLALARGLIGRAWASRGTGWASSVSDEHFRRFYSDLAEAELVLRQAPPSAMDDPQWWHEMMDVHHGLGADSAYRATYAEAVTRFPDDYTFHVRMAQHLLPRWYGAPGEWEAFAMNCARTLPRPFGAEVYARIVLVQSAYSENVFAESPSISWPLVRQGLDAWHARHPASVRPRSACAMLAWKAGRRADARNAFAAIGDTVEVDVWRYADAFLAARKWAQAGGAIAAR